MIDHYHMLPCLFVTLERRKRELCDLSDPLGLTRNPKVVSSKNGCAARRVKDYGPGRVI